MNKDFEKEYKDFEKEYEDFEKEYKEKTKLNEKELFIITGYIMTIILAIVQIILTKEIAWILILILELDLVMTYYYDVKTRKSNDMLIELKDEIIAKFLKELEEIREKYAIEILDKKKEE